MTKTQTQIKLENQINTLAKLKEQAEKAKAEFDEYRTQLENQLGLGNWETDYVKLCFSETTRNTVAWKSIAENNIKKSLLDKLVAENTSTSTSVACRITPKLVLA